MDERIKDRLAPCGIYCGKCFAFTDGPIKQLSIDLKNALGNFDAYAERFTYLLQEPVFGKYPEFSAFLTYLAGGSCKGCRKETCKLFKDCKVRDCYKEKGVDFCFQCPDFPCNETGFDAHLHKRSIEINTRIKEIGIKRYYAETKDKPRY